MLIWVVYDITSDKDRAAIAKACKEYGLIRVQYSVFFGNLPNNAVDEIAEYSRELIDEDSDAVFILPVSEDDFAKKKIIGKSFDEALATGTQPTLLL